MQTRLSYSESFYNGWLTWFRSAFECFIFLDFNTWNKDAQREMHKWEIISWWLQTHQNIDLHACIHMRIHTSGLFINKHIKTPPLVRAASVAGAKPTPPKMSEEHVAGRVWGDKRTRLKMSVSPVAMTARKVWQGPECLSQRCDSLLRLIGPVVSSKTVWGVCYKKMLGNNYTLLIMIKNTPTCVGPASDSNHSERKGDLLRMQAEENGADVEVKVMEGTGSTSVVCSCTIQTVLTLYWCSWVHRHCGSALCNLTINKATRWAWGFLVLQTPHASIRKPPSHWEVWWSFSYRCMSNYMLQDLRSQKNRFQFHLVEVWIKSQEEKKRILLTNQR